MNKKPNIVVIGGGTGSHVVLSGLKNKHANVSSIVTMMDSGGSTGRLRDQLGVLPPGDVRQALVALSDSPEIWRKLFTYRFEHGDLEGHNFGNIFLSALEKIMGNNKDALKEVASILNIKGNVYPVTYTKCVLCAKYEDGSLIQGEAHIDEALTKRPRIKYMYLSPEGIVNEDAENAVKEADLIVLGPGDLYTSILPNLLINNFSQIITNSPAKKVYIPNLMTKLGQTDDFSVSDHILEIDKYLGGGFLDYILINNKRPSNEVLDWYKDLDNVSLVEDDLYDKKVVEARLIRGDFLSDTIFTPNLSDRLKRSLIRHDPDKLSEALLHLIDNT